MAAGDGSTPDQLSHGYSAPELEEILDVLKKLMLCRDILLSVNQQYILSASQQDAFRTEPAFLLQGSYRNMNKLAERVVAVMNDAELEALIDDHYSGEAQTLTTGAEHNLLKLTELRGRLDEKQQQRWDEIKRSFVRVQAMGGAESDPVVKVTGQLGLMSDRLAEIGERIESAAGAQGGGAADAAQLAASVAGALAQMQDRLGAVAPAEASGLRKEAVASMTQGLGQLSRQLAAIGQAIAGAATSMAEATPSAPDVSPQLQQLQTTIAALNAQGGGRREVIQALPGGVHDLLDEITQQVTDTMMPAIRSLARRVEGSEDPRDKRLRDDLASTLKKLDQLRDLAAALGKLDTRKLGTGSKRR